MKLSPGLQTLLTLLPALTAALYLIGFSYYQGYLGTYGIEESMFPLASDKALFDGFFSLLLITIPRSIYAFGAIGAFMILVVVLSVLSSINRVQNLVRRLKSWELFSSTKLEPALAEDLLSKSATVYVYCAGVIIILFVIFGLAYFSDQNGRRQAEGEMKKFLAGQTAGVRVFNAQSTDPYIGKIVVCGDKYCAFWSKSGAIMMRHELINRIETFNVAHKG